MRRLLGLNPGEGRTVGLAVSASFVASVGMMIAQSGVDALFFARYGVSKLPYMYLLLGALMFIASLAISVLLGRFGRGRTFMVILLSIAVAAIVGRIALASGAKWIYGALWLLVAMSQFAVAISVWGLAGMVTDTRQAKRFFPLIGAGGVLGLILGGLVTQPLAAALTAQNLIVLWAVTLVIVIVLAATLVGKEGRRRPRRTRRPTATGQLAEGLHSVRSSTLLRWLALGSMMFSLLFFSLYLPFSRAATARYPSPERLAGFFGEFFGLATAVALLMSLFVTNRLLRRFGVPTILLILPLLYVGAFGSLTVRSTFAILAAFRFAQVVWMQGGASSAYEAVVNTVPVDRRDQTRAFLYGGPTQAGTLAAGVVSLIGEHAASPRMLYGIGLAAAGVAVVAMARVRRAYARELVLALREGRPNVFTVDPHAEEPFDLGRGDAAAVSIVVQGLSDPDPHVRRLAAHILGDLPSAKAGPALVRASRDAEPEIRETAVRSLGAARAGAAVLEISRRLADPISTVRLAALDALSSLGLSRESIDRRVHPLLEDEDLVVRARAAAVLLAGGPDADAQAVLVEIAAASDASVRSAALHSLALARDRDAYSLVRSALEDPAPSVRIEAARSLAAIDPERAADELIGSLGDEHSGVRAAVAEALASIGPAVLSRVASALFDPRRRLGALAALEHLPLDGGAVDVRRFAADSVSRAVESHRMAGLISEDSDERLSLLRASLVARAQREAVDALRAAALLGDRSAISVALENLSVTNPAQRANALEVIETVGDSALVRPLLSLWDAVPPRGDVRLPIDQLLRDPDEWIRACAELAAASIEGGPMTHTLGTLPLMERVMFLRRVPLFADLPPQDLQPIASIAEEEAFADGETIAEQGAPGEAMHLIVTGEVSIMVRREGEPPYLLAVRGRGDVIGEMAVIASRPRMAALVAQGTVRVLTIGQREFEALLRERPEISLAVMRVLCQRLEDRDTEKI